MRKFTLKTYQHSRKDYSHHKTVLGAVIFTPELLFLSPILDQNPSGLNACTAFESVACRQNEKGIEYDPLIQWSYELAMGATSEGTDIKTALATGVKSGFWPTNAGASTGAPFGVDKASAYLFVTKNNDMDLFDSIRTAIKQTGRPLSAGVRWMQEWDNPPAGIIQNLGQNILGGHAVKIAGWKTIDNIPYLVIQNSWGTLFGDQGLFYFPRAIVNAVFGPYGIGYWSDDANQQFKALGLLQALLQNLVNLYQQLIAKNTGAYPTLPPLSPGQNTNYRWDNRVAARLSVRELCDDLGLPITPTFNVDGKLHLIKDVICACIEVESDFNPNAVHYNKDKTGATWSADWGIVQINDYFHIGAGKEFPSVEYVIANPEACVRWMIKMFQAGKQSMWSSYSQGLYKKYL